MSNEFRFRYSATGATLYAILLRGSDGEVYNGSGYEVPLASHWTTYALALTEQSTTQLYYGSMPAAQSAGLYDYLVFLQAGGSPVTTDTQVGIGRIDWNTTADAGVGKLQTGNTETLALKQLQIVNSGGDAFVASATGGNGNGMNVSGAPGGHGLKSTGGAASGSTPAGHGMLAQGGVASATSGGTSGFGGYFLGGAGNATLNGANTGLRAEAGGNTTNGGAAGFRALGTGNGGGIGANGSGSGPGFGATGGTSGNGATFSGGGGNTDGLELVHAGTGFDLDATTSPPLQVGIGAAGLDSVVVETGLNARQALSIIASACAGVLAGAAGPTVTIAAAGVATNRITATVDALGDRTVVALNPPP